MTEQDTYAIMCANIAFTDIVRSVLAKLGYQPQEMVGAKGECPLAVHFVSHLNHDGQVYRSIRLFVAAVVVRMVF